MAISPTPSSFLPPPHPFPPSSLALDLQFHQSQLGRKFSLIIYFAAHFFHWVIQEHGFHQLRSNFLGVVCPHSSRQPAKVLLVQPPPKCPYLVSPPQFNMRNDSLLMCNWVVVGYGTDYKIIITITVAANISESLCYVSTNLFLFYIISFNPKNKCMRGQLSLSLLLEMKTLRFKENK